MENEISDNFIRARFGYESRKRRTRFCRMATHFRAICYSHSCFFSFIFQVPEPVPVTYHYQNHTLISMTTPPPNVIANQTIPCKWTCDLADDRGYVVYSALGSFYIPMFVMLFFYWRIYRAAVRTTRAINQGFKTTKGKRYIRKASF